MTAKKKNKQSDNKVLRFIKKHREGISEIVVILLALYIAGAINPITGPAFRYPFHVIYCGQKPVITSTFMGGRTYVTPGMNYYNPASHTDTYFCTEKEAISNNYKRSTFGED